MSDIFLSYANQDGKAARRVADALTATGWTVFWDRTIPAGRTWRDVIASELEAARCIVVLWSSHSVESHWVCEEAEEGRDRNILVPASLADVRPPIGFRSIQAASLVEWTGARNEADFQQLVQAVSGVAGSPQQSADSIKAAPDRAFGPGMPVQESRTDADSQRPAAEQGIVAPEPSETDAHGQAKQIHNLNAVLSSSHADTTASAARAARRLPRAAWIALLVVGAISAVLYWWSSPDKVDKLPDYTGPPIQWSMSVFSDASKPDPTEMAARFERELRQQSKEQITVSSAAKKGKPQEVIEALLNGKQDAAFIFPEVLSSLDPAYFLVQGAPFGPALSEQVEWLGGPGRSLVDALFSSQGLAAIPCGASGDQGDFLSRTEISTAAAIQGIKLYASGLPGEVFQQAGGRTVVLPVGEMYAALERGVIDGMLSSAPEIAMQLRLYETGLRFLTYPGVLRRASVAMLVVAESHWQALPESAQATLRATCADNVQYSIVMSREQVRKAIDQLKRKGVKQQELPPEVREALRQAWDRVALASSEASSHFGRLHAALEKR